MKYYRIHVSNFSFTVQWPDQLEVKNSEKMCCHTLLVLLVILCLVAVSCEAAPSEDHAQIYDITREQEILEESCMMLGSQQTLSPEESILNQFLLREKRRTMNESRIGKVPYLPAMSFYLSKNWMERTDIFKIIKMMPKGAALHLHHHAIVSLDWVVGNVTYRDNVYLCVESDNYIRLWIFTSAPKHTKTCQWKLVSQLRAASGNVSKFDLQLKNNLSLLSEDPVTKYKTVQDVWKRFEIGFKQTKGIFRHIQTRKDYFQRTLEEFRQDNVQYIELREIASAFEDTDGNQVSTLDGIRLEFEVMNQFVKDHPDFSGAKVIKAGIRVFGVDKVLDDIKLTMQLCKVFPNFVVGYDLVAQEDPYNTLLFYKDALLYPESQTPPVHLQYFFHAGETKFQGTKVDWNILDALLMRTKRIGHGFALSKHPRIIEMIKSKNIAVEVNPISNQVLRLVTDLRNHPAANLMAQSVPVVISSDDCEMWEALPLSHDMYVAFMAMSGANAGLTFLKQLALNSLLYSAMNDSEKAAAIRLWETKWNKFVTEAITSFKLNEMKIDTNELEVSKTICERILMSTEKYPPGNNADKSMVYSLMTCIFSLSVVHTLTWTVT